MISAVILTFCLVAEPGDCLPPKKFYLESEENLGLPMLCMKQAQHIAVEWIGSHPKYFLAKYRCQSNVVPNAKDTSNQSIATFIDKLWRDDRRGADSRQRRSRLPLTGCVSQVIKRRKRSEMNDVGAIREFEEAISAISAPVKLLRIEGAARDLKRGLFDLGGVARRPGSDLNEPPRLKPGL